MKTIAHTQPQSQPHFALKSNPKHRTIFLRFTPNSPSIPHVCDAPNLSAFGWRYQKRGSKNPILRFFEENRKNILSAFGWRYQKRRFLPPKNLATPNPSPLFLTFCAKMKTPLTCHHTLFAKWHVVHPQLRRYSSYMINKQLVAIPLLLLALSTPVLADPPPLTAKWIAFPNDDADKKPEPAPQFRTTFTLDQTHGQPTHATLLITGLGSYDCQINGKPISDHVLDPGWTTITKTVLYNTFDVTPLLHPGDNAIGITLGNGPYNVLRIPGRYTKFNGTFGVPKLCAQHQLDYSDGSHQTIQTDPSWKTTRGPITFNHQYGGEDDDARLETPGWTEPNFNDQSWQPAAEIEPPGTADKPPILTPAIQPPTESATPSNPKKSPSPSPAPSSTISARTCPAGPTSPSPAPPAPPSN